MPRCLVISNSGSLSGRNFSLHLDKIRRQDELIIAGRDFNAEVGGGKDRLHKGVLGPYGDVNRTETGDELVDFFRNESPLVADTIYGQREYATWWHPRYGSGHQLDYPLVRERDKHSLCACRAIHQEPPRVRKCYGKSRSARKRMQAAEAARRTVGGTLAWAQYTDHHPVEIVVKRQPSWAKKAETGAHRRKAQTMDPPSLHGAMPKGPAREPGGSPGARELRIQAGRQLGSQGARQQGGWGRGSQGAGKPRRRHR